MNYLKLSYAYNTNNNYNGIPSNTSLFAFSDQITSTHVFTNYNLRQNKFLASIENLAIVKSDYGLKLELLMDCGEFWIWQKSIK